jgi:hypothetical protein
MNEIEKAIQVLEDAGYYVKNLWHIDDVDDDTLTDAEKLDVLDKSIDRDSVYERIHSNMEDELLMIKYHNK